MKRYISLLLAICIILTSLFTLSSCFLHICIFSDEWSYDDTYHWKACRDRNCEKVSEKGEHAWGVGEIVKEATQEADGLSIRTCPTCNGEKEQVILYTGMSWSEWGAAFSDKNFENFTYTERAISSYSGIQAISTTVYKITEHEVYASITVGGTTSSDSVRGPQVEAVKESLVKSIKDMLQYQEFKYDREQRAYILTGKMNIPNIGSAKTATLRFEDGLPKELVYTCTVYSNGLPVDCTSTVTFRDFGTTKI